MAGRLVVSICGPSGSGKSTTAKALCERLGEHRSVRIPADYYLVPRSGPLRDYLLQPLQYDWASLQKAVLASPGSLVETPDFDFESFQRLALVGGRTFISRPIQIIDAMYPCPFADIKVLVSAPCDTRLRRIASRDLAWGTLVLNRWDHLEICRQYLQTLAVRYDVRLSGTQTVETNVATLCQTIEERGWCA